MDLSCLDLSYLIALVGALVGLFVGVHYFIQEVKRLIRRRRGLIGDEDLDKVWNDISTAQDGLEAALEGVAVALGGEIAGLHHKADEMTGLLELMQQRNQEDHGV